MVLRRVTFGGLMVARAERDGWTLTVTSRDWRHVEPVELTRVDDVEPYLGDRR